MKRCTRVVPVILLAAFALALSSGCAGTGSSDEVSDDPVLIRKEITQLDREMQNVEEMIKGSKAELQMDDNQTLRDQIRGLEMEFIQLESQKRALEERLAELEAQGTS